MLHQTDDLSILLNQLYFFAIFAASRDQLLFLGSAVFPSGIKALSMPSKEKQINMHTASADQTSDKPATERVQEK